MGGELLGKLSGRVMAALQPAIRIGRDERYGLRSRRWDDLDQDRGGGRSESPERTLFPPGDERANGIVVVNGGPGAREGEAPARALPAPAHRPRGRRAAALAERRLDPRQPREAGRT